MNQEQLNAIKERAVKATHGPWKVYQDEFSTRIGSELMHPQLKGPMPVVTEAHYVNGIVGIYINANDMDFITHAREDVPALMAEIERLREALEHIATHNIFVTPQIEIREYAQKALEGNL